MPFSLPHGEIRSADLVLQNKSHGDVVFQDSFFERLYMWSDYCDGKIWQKEHSSDCVLCRTSWYPGSYASTSYYVTLLHPRDNSNPDEQHQSEKSKIPYVANGNQIARGYDCGITRTKDYVICALIKATWGAQYNAFKVSKDGVHWRDWQGGFAAPWASVCGWSQTENAGITYGNSAEHGNGVFRLEIDEHGTINTVKLTDNYVDGSFIGDILTQGLAEDGSHRWYKFINIRGEKYTSALPGRYQYHDASESDPAQSVKWADYSWNFRYLNGKYYAFTSKEGDIYWNPVYQTWERLRSVIILESTNGFKTFTTHEMDPCPRIYFQSWDIWYFNGRFIVLEFGKEREADTDQYFKIRDINFNVLGSVIRKVEMPFIGKRIDPTYDKVSFYFKNPEAETARNCVRSFGWGFTEAVYIKEGQVTTPYGSIIFPTAFCWNGWSSGSYDCGGFIFLQYNENALFATSQPEYAAAYCTQEMIDVDNATWGEDNYKIKVTGPPGSEVRLDESSRSYYKHTYKVTIGDDHMYNGYLRFHLDTNVTASLLGTSQSITKKLMHVRTSFKFETQPVEWITDSPYYYDGNGVFTSFVYRSFTKLVAGPAYCFAVYDGSSTNPLVVSTLEEVTDYSPPGNVQLRFVEDPNGVEWAYRGFEYGFGGPRDAARYIDASSCGRWATLDDVVLFCLKTIYGW